MDIRTRPAVSLLLFVVVSITAARASQDPPRPGTTAPPAPATAANVPSVVFERQHLRVRFESDGRSTKTLTMHVRANDDAGVRQAGQIPLFYTPSTDDLEVSSLAIHKPDGRIVEVGADAIQDHAVQPGVQVPMFVDLRQKTITVPALRPGDTVVITAVWKLARPLVARQSWFEHDFAKHAVIAEEVLELDFPEGSAPIIQSGPDAPAEQMNGMGRVNAGRRIYLWKTANPKVAEESSEPAADDTPVPDLRITTFRGWTAFADWISPLMRPAGDQAVREKAESLTRGLPDADAKIEALYRFVSNEIRYVSLSIGLNRYAPHAPNEVLKKQYGDCKDKHALLAAMLRAVGVNAVPVLVNTGRSITDDFAAPTEFNHVVTAIASGPDPSRWQWLDTTLEVAPRGLLGPSVRGRRALSLGGDRYAAQVLTIPENGPFPFVETTSVDASVNPLGVLAAKVRLTLRGDSELVLRTAVRITPRESLKEFGEAAAKALGFPGQITDFTFSDPLATREPFEFGFTVRQAGYLDWASDSATIATPTGRLGDEGFNADRLKTDRKMKGQPQIRRSLTIRLPPGYAATAPVGVRAAKGDYVYTSRYSVDASVLRIERALENPPPMMHARDATEFVTMFRSIAADHAQTFRVVRQSKTVPPVPDDMTAPELYSAGYSAFSAKQFEASITIWNRALALDPKMADALTALGLAYQRLKRYDEAIATLEKLRALEPGNTRVDADLGFVYGKAGRLERAAEAYARHLSTRPLDGARHQSLGEIYLDLDRHADALASFEKALPLTKDDPWLHQQMGRSLLGLGRTAAAMEAFEKALKPRRTPALLSSIAWTLAERGVEPARAADLSAETIASITASMKALTAADVSSEHFDLMERLAWAWDARGLLHLQRREVDQAITLFEAAWQLDAKADVALHLAQAYEQKERRANAAEHYMFARALDSTPSKTLEAALKRHYPAGVNETWLNAAANVIIMTRSVKLAHAATEGRARFNAILAADGRVLETALLDGDDALAPVATELRTLKFTVTAPGADDFRFASRIRVACEKNICYANVMRPSDVE